MFAGSRNVIAPVPTQCHGPSSNLENRVFPPESRYLLGAKSLRQNYTFQVLDLKHECANKPKSVPKGTDIYRHIF
jgi:hypothetical protein